MANQVPNLGSPVNPAIVHERVGEIEIAPVVVRNAGCLTGFARWICACEDAGGLWKVLSYALRFFSLIGSMITLLGVPFYILADREIVLVDLEMRLRRDGMLTAPNALLQAQEETVEARGQRDDLQAEVDRLTPLAADGAQKDERIAALEKQVNTIKNTTLVEERERVVAEQASRANQPEEVLRQENERLKQEVANLRSAMVTSTTLSSELDPLIAKIFSTQTPSKTGPHLVTTLQALPERQLTALRAALDSVASSNAPKATIHLDLLDTNHHPTSVVSLDDSKHKDK